MFKSKQVTYFVYSEHKTEKYADNRRQLNIILIYSDVGDTY